MSLVAALLLLCNAAAEGGGAVPPILSCPIDPPIRLNSDVFLAPSNIITTDSTIRMAADLYFGPLTAYEMPKRFTKLADSKDPKQYPKYLEFSQTKNLLLWKVRK
jgi:hypothetical protein